MTRGPIRLALLAAAFALGTWALGWWAVPALAALWGAGGALLNQGPTGPTRAGRHAALEAALAALVAWGAILAVAAARAPLGALADRLGGIMRLPAAALVLLTLVFPALLAWSAAALGRGIPLLIAKRPT